VATGGQQAAIVVLADAEIDEGFVQTAQVIDAGAAGGREIAILGGIDALAVFQAADQLGNQEIEIHVALAVGVRHHVGRHAHDLGGEVAAVVEIETAQEILVGLAVARVLGDDHAGHGFHDLGRAQQRPVGQLFGGDGAFAGRVGDAGQVLAAAADGDFLQGRHAGRVGLAECGQGSGEQRKTKGRSGGASRM